MPGSPPQATIVLPLMLASMATLAIPGSAILGFGPAWGETPIRAGVVLIANPHMEDPNFRQTVVLICRHGPDGTLGFVLNRQTDLRLADILPDRALLKDTPHPVFAGGPVQPRGVLFLYRVAQRPADTEEVMDGVYWGGNLDEVERIAKEGKPTETFRAFAGHAGWAPGQLQSEIAVGGWAVLPAEASRLFEQDPDDLWRHLLDQSRSPRYIHQTRTRRAASSMARGPHRTDVGSSMSERASWMPDPGG